MKPPTGLTLLVGGARSGKSALAVRLASGFSGPVVFVATAIAGDDDMVRRVERHRAERPRHWTTVESPTFSAEDVTAIDPAACVIVDCVTLWVNEQMMAASAVPGRPAAEAGALAAAAAAADPDPGIADFEDAPSAGVDPASLDSASLDEAIVRAASVLAAALAARSAPALVITNEVGLGIVPMNALARRYRDVLGNVNRAIADAASQSYFVAAGQLLPLQRPQETFA